MCTNKPKYSKKWSLVVYVVSVVLFTLLVLPIQVSTIFKIIFIVLFAVGFKVDVELEHRDNNRKKHSK